MTILVRGPAACAALLAVVLASASSATERSIAIVKNDALERVTVQQEGVQVVARGQGTTLVCVSFGGQRHWAKPEIWMTSARSYTERVSVPAGEVSGGGNGLGNIRDLPAIPTGDC